MGIIPGLGFPLIAGAVSPKQILLNVISMTLQVGAPTLSAGTIWMPWSSLQLETLEIVCSVMMAVRRLDLRLLRKIRWPLVLHRLRGQTSVVEGTFVLRITWHCFLLVDPRWTAESNQISYFRVKTFTQLRLLDEFSILNQTVLVHLSPPLVSFLCLELPWLRRQLLDLLPWCDNTFKTMTSPPGNNDLKHFSPAERCSSHF
mmetsp:Transcript_4616/g.8063  ORF Transcript_4616/g.8063 Transcript_4616/m.8063 type:complete len:202 (+) Transcript_4616:670-1275(+)